MSSTTVGGDSVTNQNGEGTGEVAGVKIEVQGLKDKSAGVTHAFDLSQGPEGTGASERWDVNFGEVRLVLERENDGPIMVKVDGKIYGTVEKGDRLVIDKDRNVSVNGQSRVEEKTAASN